MPAFNLIFLVLLIGPTAFACEFKVTGDILSFSGPATHFFHRLGLLGSGQVKAISTFHAIDKKHFEGERLGGGQYLSQRQLSKYASPFLIFDKSIELKRLVDKWKVKHYLEIDTRNLDPFAVEEKLATILLPLTKNCQSGAKTLNQKLQKLKENVLGFNKLPYPVIFYLGEYTPGQRPPNTLMVNDGAVKFLLDNDKITTYPTTLAYVPWSQKVLAKMTKKSKLIKIGLSGKGPKALYQTSFGQHTKSSFNAYNRTGLIPGYPQAVFMRDILAQLSTSKILGKKKNVAP